MAYCQERHLAFSQSDTAESSSRRCNLRNKRARSRHLMRTIMKSTRPTLTVLTSLLAATALFGTPSTDEEYLDRLKQGYDWASRSTAGLSIPDKLHVKLWVGKGRKRIKELAAERPQSLLAPSAQAWASFMAERDEALTDFDNMLRIDPMNIEARRGKAWYLLLQRRYGDALRAFDDFVKTAPQDPGAHGGRALVRYRLGKVAEARDDVSRFLCLGRGIADTPREMLAPDYAKILRNKAQEFVDSVPKAKRTADFYLMLGVIFVFEGKTGSSEMGRTWKLARDSARNESISHPAFLLAIGDYSEARRTYPQCAEAHFIEALDYLRTMPNVSGSAFGVTTNIREYGYSHEEAVMHTRFAILSYGEALRLKPGDPIFLRAQPLLLEATTALEIDQKRIDQRNAEDQQFRDDLKRIAKLTIDLVSVYKAVVESVDPEYVSDKSATVKYRGADQCKLCGGTGRVLAHPFVVNLEPCPSCKDADFGSYCSMCKGKRTVEVTKRGNGPRQVEECVDCGGSGHFDGNYSISRLNEDGRVLPRSIDKMAAEHGQKLIEQMSNSEARSGGDKSKP